LRQGDRAEKRLWVEVILARLVDYPQLTMLLGSGIAKRDIIFRFSSDVE
jgi:hypothetical protein